MPNLSPGPAAERDLNTGSTASRASPIKMPQEEAEELAEPPTTTANNGLRRPSNNMPALPVIPDFDDIVPRRRGSQVQHYEPEPVQIKRKTSIVKKLTGRVG